MNRNAPVAQLDRALPSEGKGHTFESCRVRQQFQHTNNRVRPPAIAFVRIMSAYPVLWTFRLCFRYAQHPVAIIQLRDDRAASTSAQLSGLRRQLIGGAERHKSIQDFEYFLNGARISKLRSK